MRTSVAFFRSLCFYVWWVSITIPFSVLALLITFFPLPVRYRIISQWSRLTIQGVRFCCGVRYLVQGRENLPKDEAVVFLSRHESAWETIFFQCLLPPQSIVVKRQLLWIPFFGWGLSRMAPIVIDRLSPRKALRQIEKQGKKQLYRGFSVVVFPEGMRLLPGEQREYLPGGAWLAKRACVKVVPIAVNSGHLWPKGRMIKHAGTITVGIGSPFQVDNLSVAEINQQARTQIEAMLSAKERTGIAATRQ